MHTKSIQTTLDELVDLYRFTKRPHTLLRVYESLRSEVEMFAFKDGNQLSYRGHPIIFTPNQPRRARKPPKSFATWC
jgi:hypothetical protein